MGTAEIDKLMNKEIEEQKDKFNELKFKLLASIQLQDDLIDAVNLLIKRVDNLEEKVSAPSFLSVPARFQRRDFIMMFTRKQKKM